MKEQVIAARLFQLKERTTDVINLVIETERLIRGEDVELIMKNYRDILSKDLIIVMVVSALELKQEEKDKITNFVTKSFSDRKLVFLFDVEKSAKGLTISIADDIIDFSLDGVNF